MISSTSLGFILFFVFYFLDINEISLNPVPAAENEEPTENEINPDLAKVILTDQCFFKIHKEILVP